MRFPSPANLRSRLTLWYTGVLALLLVVYAVTIFAFQYVTLTRQMLHDEVLDVITVEGLLYFDTSGDLQLHQDYYSRQQSHLLVDRYMQVFDSGGKALYTSPTLHNMRLGGSLRDSEGDRGFDERIVKLADGTHVFLISHVHGMDGRILLIRLGYSLAPLRERMLQFLLLLVVAIPIAILLAAIAGQTIARRALLPIDQMSTRAAQITANNLHDRLKIANPHDELGRMATTFNHLLGRLEDAFQQLKRFTSDAAHELRTPLASIRTISEVSLSRENATDSRKVIEDILEEASRLNSTIDSLLLLSRVESSNAPGQYEPFLLLTLVEEITNLMSLMMEEAGIAVRVLCEPAVYLQADRNLLRVALLNIVHNAWKFSPRGSTITIECVSAEDQGTVQISIQDEGPGIAAKEVPHVFDRFFTGSSQAIQTQKGTGLGLSITKLIIERCGGTIAFDAGVKSGAICVIQLPQQPLGQELL